MAQYIVGTAIRIDAIFLDEDGNKVDPTEVKFEIKLPDGTCEHLDSDVVRYSIGDYYIDYTPTMNGLHQYRFYGTGLVEAANEGYFTAQTSFADC